MRQLRLNPAVLNEPTERNELDDPPGNRDGADAPRKVAEHPTTGFALCRSGRLRSTDLGVRCGLGVEEARGVLETWKEEYNNDRPHGSLQQMTPARYRAGVITAQDRDEPETRRSGGSEKG